MRILQFLLPFLFASLVLFGCYVDSGRKSRSEIDGYDRYSNKTINVSLLTPTGWDAEVNIGGVYVVTPPAPSGGQIYVMSSSVERLMGEEASESADLEAYREYMWSQITEEEVGPGLDRSIGKSSLAGNDAYEIRYSFEPETDPARWFVWEVFTLVDGKVYRIRTYSTEKADPEFQKTVETMMASYRILR